MATTTYALHAATANGRIEGFIYRSIVAGVCAPASEVRIVDTLEELEAWAAGNGFVKVDGWHAFGNAGFVTAVELTN